MPDYASVEQTIGHTPLVKLQRLSCGRGNTVLLKLEGNNPAGSVKDRAAFSMIHGAEARGLIRPGDTLIEATSGNTGIALAMAAAVRGYRLVIIMPEHMSIERRQIMRAYGAELVLTSKAGGMEAAITLARQMQQAGQGIILDQFGNADNPMAHVLGTGPEIWRDTDGEITHFVSSMGTTGTITGTARYLKAQNPAIRIVGVQPAAEAEIPGIRTWPAEFLPAIYDASLVDEVMYVSQADAEETARVLARQEGIFAGISSGGAAWAALALAQQISGATIVSIACDRGDRYLSTGVFPAV
jgi:cysteine synthase B